MELKYRLYCFDLDSTCQTNALSRDGFVVVTLEKGSKKGKEK